MSGIYAGDGDQLSLAATFPTLRDLERKYGSLARGALKMRKAMGSNQKSGWRSSFLTPLTGLGEIIETLVQELSRLGAELYPSSRVISIERGKSTGRGGFILTVEPNKAFSVDGLILAANAFQSGQLLKTLNAELSELLQSIPYTSTATISLAYRADDLPRPLDGYGYVIPRREKRRALACTWTSTKFPHRAPPGYVLLRVFAGRAGEEAELPDSEDALLEIAKEELRLSLKITAEPLLHKVFYWEKAMPQYNLGHLMKLQRIDAILQSESALALAGNGYRGIGIPDCIVSGEQAVNRVMSSIKEKVYED
jgi:oxygen-dependent protoporphyrinogen oxidase